MIIGVFVLLTLWFCEAEGMAETPLLSTVIWLPILAGVAVLFTGSDRNSGLARWLALAGAVAGFVVRCRSMPISIPPRRNAVYRVRTVDRDVSTSITTLASMASRCC